MNEPLQRFLTPILQRWLGMISNHARRVSILCLFATAAALVFAFFNLGINSDNLSLISKDLPSRINQAEFAALFPNLEEAILIVVDGDTPALAREATDALANKLSEDQAAFKDVYVPGGGPFFEDHALLYQTPEQLDQLGDDLAALQPVMASLEADPSLVKLSELVRLGLEGDDDGGEGFDADRWTPLLDEIAKATTSAYQEFPLRVSWETMLLSGSDLEIPTRRVIVVDPYLEYDKILVANSSIEAILSAVEKLGLDDRNGVEIRITGNPALNHEEMLGLAWDIGGAGVFCFLLVAGFLYFAFRSWRLVFASLGTLLVGLVWTGAFAAATIGELNLISIAFAILFIGLGVDFAIHFGMAFLAERRDHDIPTETALHKAVDSIGASLVLCGFTTAIGFLVFLPAEYRGVAELGAIAGAGMFIILFLTLTFFPALLAGWLRPPDELKIPAPTRVDQVIALRIGRRPRLVCSIALLAALGASPLLLQLRFDAHVIEMRDPDTPSVQAFRDLLEDEDSSPWYANILVPSVDDLPEMTAALEALPEVGRIISLTSYLPDDQDEKLEILEDLSFMMEAPTTLGTLGDEAPSYTIQEQIRSLHELQAALRNTQRPPDQAIVNQRLESLEENISRFMTRIERDENPGQTLEQFRDILLGGMPEAIERLHNSLSADAIELNSLPPDLLRRLLAENGTARIQAFPAEELQDFDTLRRFAKSVLAIAPKATGVAPNLVDFGEATARSFRQALLSAAVAISALLFVLWRRPSDVALVLIPLALGSILTCASMVMLNISFNFANILVLPLLFGIGVDSGIHLVHRARSDAQNDSDQASHSLVETATAGAVFYSAMTTTLSFGTLALSGHQGMHTLGIMLTIGMFWTIVANLIVLPAMLVVSGISRPIRST